jgi:hypothetical protein
LSTLGKILTVLVALVSIAVAVLVAREFVMTRNWKEAYDGQVKLTQRVVDERENAIKQRDDVKATAERDKLAFEAQRGALTDAVAQRDASLANLRTEKENQETRLQQLVTNQTGLEKSMANLIADKVKLQDDRDKALLTASQYTQMYSELEVRYRTDQANLANLKGELLQAQAQIADLGGKIQAVKQTYAEVKIPEKGPYPPVASMSGLVTHIDNEAKVCEINLGSDDKVVPGTKFVVYSEPGTKYLATLTIKKVGPKTAAGDLSVIRGTVKVSDHVQNKPGE